MIQLVLLVFESHGGKSLTVKLFSARIDLKKLVISQLLILIIFP